MFVARDTKAVFWYAARGWSICYVGGGTAFDGNGRKEGCYHIPVEL